MERRKKMKEERITNIDETGKKYKMIERFYSGQGSVSQIEFEVAYIGRVNFLGREYELFAHKGQEEGI
ncbi:MAG: hypothetical protein ABH804_00705, partial [archaeon]